MSRAQLKEYLFIVVTLLICGILYRESASFDSALSSMTSSYGPAFFPRVLLVLLMLLSCYTAVQVWRKPPVEEPPLSMVERLRMLALTGLCLFFAFAWDFMGFLPAVCIFAALCCALLRPKPMHILIIALFIPIAWYAFTKIFMVSL